MTVSRGRQLMAVLILPFVVTAVVPALLVVGGGSSLTGSLSWLRWPLAAAGAALLFGGVALAGWTIETFRREGNGTLAPWDPTDRLIVTGVYRHVRNPMITGVMAVLLGEALILDRRSLLVWFVIFVAVNAIYIPLAEEPGLVSRFGSSYEEYRRNVPRWIPRRTPWTPPSGGP